MAIVGREHDDRSATAALLVPVLAAVERVSERSSLGHCLPQMDYGGNTERGAKWAAAPTRQHPCGPLRKEGMSVAQIGFRGRGGTTLKNEAGARLVGPARNPDGSK